MDPVLLHKTFERVAAEIRRADEKHGDFPEDLLLRVCIVAEEMGEVQKAVVDYKLAGAPIEDVDTEMVQLAAMAIKFLISRRTL
jgi:NTP pyrophosphatase (non-canonical NTP hydrolase)